VVQHTFVIIFNQIAVFNFFKVDHDDAYQEISKCYYFIIIF